MAALPDGARWIPDLLAGWRGLGRFWAAVLLTLGVTATVLQTLGPPPKQAAIRQPERRIEKNAGAAPKRAAAVAEIRPLAPAVMASRRARPGRDLPGPIADPDPAMLVPFAGLPKTDLLPRVAVDGRMPMSAYAAGFDPSNLRPKVGLLIAGIGMSEAESLDAIKNLPGGVTLAISAYATDAGRLLRLARMHEHEYLLSIPMEPEGFPVNDPDDRVALMTSLPPDENLTRLRGLLGRFSGYVGITDAMGPLHGERLAGMPDQLDAVLEEVAHRGLLFVDARTGQKVQPYAWNRSVDVIIDADPVSEASLDIRLQTLTRLALDRGSALGLVSVPRPVTLARVAAWSNLLAAKGVALAPVSALVSPPAKMDDAATPEAAAGDAKHE